MANTRPRILTRAFAPHPTPNNHNSANCTIFIRGGGNVFFFDWWEARENVRWPWDDDAEMGPGRRSRMGTTAVAVGIRRITCYINMISVAKREKRSTRPTSNAVGRPLTNRAADERDATLAVHRPTTTSAAARADSSSSTYLPTPKARRPKTHPRTAPQQPRWLQPFLRWHFG